MTSESILVEQPRRLTAQRILLISIAVACVGVGGPIGGIIGAIVAYYIENHVESSRNRWVATIALSTLLSPGVVPLAFGTWVIVSVYRLLRGPVYIQNPVINVRASRSRRHDRRVMDVYDEEE